MAEQLLRVAGLELAVEVEAAPGAPEGLGWRTRVRYRRGRQRPGRASPAPLATSSS